MARTKWLAATATTEQADATRSICLLPIGQPIKLLCY